MCMNEVIKVKAAGMQNPEHVGQGINLMCWHGMPGFLSEGLEF